MNATVQQAPAPGPAMNGPAAAAPARRPQWWEGLIPRFDLGSIIPLAVVGVLGFFFFRSETGQNFLRGIIGMLPESWQNGVNAFVNNLFEGFAPDAANQLAESMTAEQARTRMTGQGIPEGVAQVVAPNDAGWRDFVGQVREAGGNIMNPVSDKVIYQLMTQRPQLVQNMLRALPRDGAAANSTHVAQARTALAAIVNDPARFNVLFSEQHRANTLTTIEIAVQQFVPLQQGALARFMETMPAEGVRNFLGAMLNTDEAARNTALFNLVKTADPAALSQLFRAIDTTALQEQNPALCQMIAMGCNTQNLTALRTLAGAVDEATLREAFSVIGSGDVRRIGTLLTENASLRAALVTFAQGVDMNSMPADWRAGLSVLRGGDATVQSAAALAQSIDLPAWEQRVFGGTTNPSAADLAANLATTMLDSRMRDQLTQNNGLYHMGRLLGNYAQSAPAEQREAVGFLSHFGKGRDGQDRYLNLYSLQIFFTEIGRNPDNRSSGERTHRVLTGLTRFLAGDREALAGLPAAEVSSFFQSRGNRVAFGNLLTNIKTDSLPREQQVILREMRQHWGNGEQGIAEMLADPASVTFMLEVLSGQRKAPAGGGLPIIPGMNSGIQQTLNFLGRQAVWSGMDFGAVGLTPVMRENRAVIEDMMRDLRAAGVSLDAAAGAAPRSGESRERQ